MKFGKRRYLTMLIEKFQNDKTGQEVDGITIIIDGKIKEIFDTIILKSGKYENYSEVLRDAIFMGINEITSSLKNKLEMDFLQS
ncbi:hypothetical protein [Acetivibrio clariflavus]|uniref:Uncharacterized protein n=1 Tax=Acetivibrio clariflavus (strain DSM 19732 / NBRC 101661 / EBR45) TaxID=720554 RepID=G8LZX5_ACECE|nr:hypothetical protein [Acetivibrio clariflavus]AEV69065.1 hypothetical protein Clocl_2492 [Acetivibrio clariflavus DSM 19732]